MQSKDLRDDAKSLVTQAEASITSGDAEQAEKLVAEAKGKIATANALDAAASEVKNLTDMWGEDGVQRIPVASEDVRKYNLDEGGAKLKASYKPADWVKGLPAASQPTWVLEKSGIREKEEAVFYTDVFTKYVRSANDAAFRLSLTPQETKAMEEGTDTLQLCPLS